MSLAIKAPQRKSGRYTTDAARSVSTGDSGAVAPGVDRNGDPFVVYTLGAQVTALPSHVVGVALTSGKVWPLDDIVTAFAEAGTLPKLDAAIVKFRDAEVKRAAALAGK